MKSENKDMYVILSKQGSRIRVKFSFIVPHNGKLWLRVEVSCPVTNLTKLIYYEVNLKVGFHEFQLKVVGFT